MSWADDAEALLAAANSATLTAPVARSVVAPGPSIARDCRMFAVWLDPVDVVQLGPNVLPGGACAIVPVTTLRLLFVADCFPTANDQGVPPPADDVTAWSLDFYADVEAVWNAVADLAASGALGECQSVEVGTTEHLGPLGQTARVIIPVRIAQVDGDAL